MISAELGVQAHGMQMLIDRIGDGLTLIGVFILIGAFFRIWRLTKELKVSPIVNLWRLLNLYIAFFTIGYLVFAVMSWDEQRHWYVLLISTILFFGSIYVWAVSLLAQQTVLDMQRVALLEHQNITDALTGLYNRRYLDLRTASEYESARRYRLPLSVLMIDIDCFKLLNDEYGHHAGDLALRFLGELVLDSIRKPDTAARYGGEEFVVIAPNTNLQAAGELAERIRKRVESHELKLARADEDRQTIRIAISIGVAELPPDILSGERLIECADKALYQAKQSGRNRVVLYRSGMVD